MKYTYVLRYNNDNNIYINSISSLNSALIINDFKKKFNEDNFTLIGLYNTYGNVTFIDYDNHIHTKDAEYNPYLLYEWDDNDKPYICENNLTEIYMCRTRYNWWNITGGKYINNIHQNIVMRNIKKMYRKLFIKKINRPLCNCGYPCEVMKKKNNNIYFVCPLKRMSYIHLENIVCEKGCNFYQKYTKDIIKKDKYFSYKALYYDYTIEKWVNNLPCINENTDNVCISCNKYKFDLVHAYNKSRLVCKKCFMKRFYELKKIYKK
jgi:hypothetical protein